MAQSRKSDGSQKPRAAKKSVVRPGPAKQKTKADEPKEAVICSVKISHLDQVPQVVENLRAAGLKVDQVIGSSIFAGSVPSSKLQSLKGVSGVDVEVERSSQVPPPESDIQ